MVRASTAGDVAHQHAISRYTLGAEPNPGAPSLVPCESRVGAQYQHIRRQAGAARGSNRWGDEFRALHRMKRPPASFARKCVLRRLPVASPPFLVHGTPPICGSRWELFRNWPPIPGPITIYPSTLGMPCSAAMPDAVSPPAPATGDRLDDRWCFNANCAGRTQRRGISCCRCSAEQGRGRESDERLSEHSGILRLEAQVSKWRDNNCAIRSRERSRPSRLITRARSRLSQLLTSPK
jgi:hypothetical protein